MITGLLGWFMAGICVLVFVTLWFIVCFRELSTKRKRLTAISEQVQIHRRLYMQERGGENDAAAQKIFENKLMVYREVEKEYNLLLKRPMNRIPAYVMGFHPAGKGRGGNGGIDIT